MVLVILFILAQIIGGIVYGNLTEWIMHKYVLHGLGKDKNSYFSYHWHVHHKLARRNKYKDPEYDSWWWDKTTTRRSEVYSLAILLISQIWIVLFLPIFYATCVAWAFLYYFLHKKSHEDIDWAKKWLPHHYDHHMGLDQNKNWCVTIPLWDYLLGTRRKYEYDENGKVVKPKKRSVAFG